MCDIFGVYRHYSFHSPFTNGNVIQPDDVIQFVSFAGYRIISGNYERRITLNCGVER